MLRAHTRDIKQHEVAKKGAGSTAVSRKVSIPSEFASVAPRRSALPLRFAYPAYDPLPPAQE